MSGQGSGAQAQTVVEPATSFEKVGVVTLTP